MRKVGKYNNGENTLMLKCLHFSKKMDTRTHQAPNMHIKKIYSEYRSYK